MRRPGKLVLCVLSVLLAGCGFYLRGQAKMPPEMAVTYIKEKPSAGPRSSELAATLERLLLANGIKVIADPQAATAVLEIFETAIRRRTLAASPVITSSSTQPGETEQLREYILRYNVDYQVTLANGKTLIPRETVSASRNLLSNESKVLAQTPGEEILVGDMISDVSRTIMLRLQAARL
jgi:LPS-assembly lipoprotein